MTHKKLLILLLASVLLATLAGVARLLWIGTQLQGESPLALAVAPGLILLMVAISLLDDFLKT
jgi:hypothetical protein